MKTDLYIPSTLVIGFQKRTDTFTGKLAYVIYKDHTGKLRKEVSWNTWRNKDIETLEITNDPTQGFTFNKGVTRDGYWGNGRSVIRVWDPRDFEFEISVDNMIGLLMHSDVSKRDIVEKCVFAWYGTELILLPTNSVEYEESTKHTEKQSQKIGAKELKIGATYTIKKERRQVVYLGRHDRYELERIYKDSDDTYFPGYVQKAKKKHHVFMDPTTCSVEVKDPTTYLAYCDSEDSHPDYATMMEKYFQSAASQPIIGVKFMHGDDEEGNIHDGMWIPVEENLYVRFAHTNTYSREGARRIFRVDCYGRYNDTNKRFEQSYRGDERTQYGYYNQPNRTYYENMKNLPGVDTNRPHLDDVAASLTAKYFDIEQQCYKFEYYEQQKVVRERFAEVKKAYGLGSLAFVLENGNLAEDGHIY